jgi:hypothetical protein
MKKTHSLGFVIGSALMMLSLFLPLCFNFIPYDIVWTFPFFDGSTQEFSFNPVEYRTYPIQTIAPFYFPYLLIPIYLLSKSLIPDMVVSIGKLKINLWSYHLTYVSLQAIDLFLSFSQTPYFRTGFIVVGVVLHVRWLLDNIR